MTDPERPFLITTPADDPRPSPGTDQVMSITIQLNDAEFILPVCPATATLRLYQTGPAETTNQYGEPDLTLAQEIPVTSENNGWTSAAAIADAVQTATPGTTA